MAPSPRAVSFLPPEMPSTPFAPGNAPALFGGGRLSAECLLLPGSLGGPAPSPGAGEERRAVAGAGHFFCRAGAEGRGGVASAVTEQRPREPRPFPPLPGPAAAGAQLVGAQVPRTTVRRRRPLARRQGNRGSLAAPGLWRRDPAPRGRLAPIAAAVLVTRRVGLRARGQRPAAAGVAAGRGRRRGRGGGGGWRVEIGASGRPAASLGAAQSRPEPGRGRRARRPTAEHPCC